MAWGTRIAAAFSMDETTWARHANPWSVWTRVAALPLFILAIWSRTWLGWGALVPVATMVIWLWVNPRIFPSPKTTRSWASKAVLGERVWLNSKAVPIPSHHAFAATLLALVSLSGLPFLAWGLYQLEIWPTLVGLILVLFGKLWFVDRMVWLYDDMRDATPEYRSWLY